MCPMRDPNKTCKTCSNYQHMCEPDEVVPGPTGECRDAAPVGGSGGRGWPLVVLEDWCPRWDRDGVMEDVASGGVRCTGCAWEHPKNCEEHGAWWDHVCADHPAENLPAPVPE